MLLQPKTVLYNKEKFQVLVFLPIYNISKIKKKATELFKVLTMFILIKILTKLTLTLTINNEQSMF